MRGSIRGKFGQWTHVVTRQPSLSNHSKRMVHELRVLLAPNAMKECLTAREICVAMRSGLNRFQSQSRIPCVFECDELPLADGGDGTAEVLCEVMGGDMIDCEVLDPLGRPIVTQYAVFDSSENPGSKVAVIELASASGLSLLDDREKNPLKTTTFGTGQMITHCLQEFNNNNNNNLSEIIVCVGGSATTDAGIGLAQALGVKFLDKSGEWCDSNTPLCGGDIASKVAKIDEDSLNEVRRMFDGIKVTVACDVNNPLLGRFGASQVFGPQKIGHLAIPDESDRESLVMEMERNVQCMVDLWSESSMFDEHSIHQIVEMEGSGAAGGTGAALMVYCGAQLQSGFELVAYHCGLDDRLKKADLVITAEGALDSTSDGGKVPVGVAKHAARNGHDTVAIVVGAAVPSLHASFFRWGDSATLVPFVLANRPMSLDDSLREAPELIANSTASIVSMYLYGRSKRMNEYLLD